MESGIQQTLEYSKVQLPGIPRLESRVKFLETTVMERWSRDTNCRESQVARMHTACLAFAKLSPMIRNSIIITYDFCYWRRFT